MYPECLGMDLTFGTNKQRRPLFLVAGVDGSNHTFTMFRAFMPSKQARAFRWVILKALPALVGSETLKYVSFIASDQADSLCKAISSAITLKICPNAKQRYDFFHVFVLPWKNLRLKDTPVSSLIYKWIFSWFDSIENSIEFQHSYSRLHTYINNQSDELNPISNQGILDLILDIVSKIQYCGNHFFLDVGTYGFKGDSFAESMNSSLKNGAVSIDGRMNIDRSATVQMDMVRQRTYVNDMYVFRLIVCIVLDRMLTP